MKLEEIVKLALAESAGDIHLKPFSKPSIRVAGALRHLDAGEISEKEMLSVVESILNKRQLNELKEERCVDVIHDIDRVCRLRINVFFQKGRPALSARVVPREIPVLEDLGYPDPVVKRISGLKEGLFLVTGPTNAGKSTTIASVVDNFAIKGNCHVITLEDPVEFIYPKYAKSLVDQRQVGRDTPDFVSGLTDALRQGPDVLVIGEMRDPATLDMAIKAASSGLLVISTFHTPSAIGTIARIVNSFPGYQRTRIRNTLASILKGVTAQMLLTATDRKSRVLAYESLFVNSAAAKLIRDDKLNQLETVMQLSRGKTGGENCLMADTIGGLVKENKVLYTDIPEEFRKVRM